MQADKASSSQHDDEQDSFGTDQDPNENPVRKNSFEEDAPERISFVPKEIVASGSAAGSGPLVMKRKLTIKKEQIVTKDSGSPQDNTLLSCLICSNVMLDPRECNKCRKGYCRKCIDDYINNCIRDDCIVCCPQCSSTTFRLVDPHPLLQRQLSVIKATCENADKGCTTNIAYRDLATHQEQCDFATVKCTNYGCEAEMLQKDFVSHEGTCEFKVDRCDKCDVVKVKDEEHDCIQQMAKKYDHMESKLFNLAAKLNLEIERADRNRLAADRGTQFTRQEIPLVGLSQVHFNAQFGWQQQLETPVEGLPANTRIIILKFGLTDLNARRDYNSLVIYQGGSESKVDLTNHFFVGPNRLPPFGQMTEVMMPWDENLEQKLICEFTIAPPQMNPYASMPPQPYHNNQWGGAQAHGHNPYGPPSAFGQGPPQHDSMNPNPFAYAVFSIGGYLHKQ